MKKILLIIFLLPFLGFGQCPLTGSYTISSSQNWTAISGISTCSSALVTANSTFNGNVSISYSGSSNNLTFNVNNLIINGNLVISSTANGNVFTVAANTTLTIIGDLGDPANNNISYQLGNGAVLIVTGTIYGRNGNTIGGSGGTVSAGGVNFSPGDLECVTGDCPKLNITTCTDTGSACSVNNNNICTTSYGGTVNSNQSSCLSSFDPTLLTVSGFTGSVLRWEKSTNGGTSWVGVNNTGSTYDPSSISTTTMYRAVVLNTSSTSCISYSTSATATVSAPAPTTPGAITGTATQCPSLTGQIYSITAVANATSYSWTVPTGWSVTAGASTNAITVTSGTSGQNGNITVTASNSCGTSTSQILAVTVRPVFTSGTISSIGETICYNGDPSVIGSTTASSGGDNTITYKWQANGVDIASSNTATYNPPTGLTTNTTYTRYAKDNTCNTTFTVSSGSWLVTVDPASVGGSIAGSTSVCTSTNSTTLTLSGYTGSITKWQSSPSSTFASSVTDIANTTTTLTATNLTTTTYYRAVVTSGTCSATNSATGSIIVNPNLAASVSISASPSGAICSGTSVTFTATPTYGGITPSYQWKLNGVNVGSDSSTYTNAALVNGDLVICEMTSNATPCLTGSPATSNTITITVNPLPSTPTVGAITNINCTSTGSIVLNDLPSGSWTINQTGTATASYAGSTASYIVTGLAAGNYTFTVTNADGCPSPATSSQSITDASSTTWNGSAWSNGSPTSLKAIVFNGNFTSTTDIEGCSCQVTNGAKVVINPTHTLTVTNSVDVVSGSTLTFENNASLVQINEDPEINSGEITYKRITPLLNRYDFTYWSSPVTSLIEPQTLYKLSPNTLGDKYYSYNNGWKIEYNGAIPMLKGRGYIIRAPQDYAISGNPQSFEANFKGTPHNGLESFSIEANQTHLLGNPYPSALDADAFLNLNSGVLEGTLYFWTHNTPPRTGVPNGDATYSYVSSDYAIYNRTGGVGTTAAIEGAVSTGGAVLTGKIAAGQGFFAPAKATGNVVFNNTMRYTVGQPNYDNSQFFKLSSTSKTTTTVAATEKSRVWLNLTNKQGAFKQMLVGYISGATNDYDAGFDGMSYDGNQFVDFYSVNNAVNLAIQGRALPFVKQDSVALGYKSTIVGEFQISIDRTDGALAIQNIFLEDKDLKVLHDLKKAPYTFTTEKGAFKNRFVLRYVDKNAVEEVVEPETAVEVSKDVVVAVKDREITINSAEVVLDKIVVYDITGKIIYQQNEIAKNVFVIPHLISSQQLLLVDVLLSDGSKFSTKIIY